MRRHPRPPPHREAWAVSSDQVTVKVGFWNGDHQFEGRTLSFRGTEIGNTTHHTPARRLDDRGVTYTLFELPDGRYKLHVNRWSRWQGEFSEATLDGPLTFDELAEQHATVLSMLGIPIKENADAG